MVGVEVVVVGSGVIGGSIAYHLARQGRRVLMVERERPAVEPAASWASAGGVRRQGRDPAEAALAIEAIERWPSLTEELGANLAYQQGGNLYVGEGDQEAEQVARFVERQHANGFADVRLLDGKEAHEVAPALSATVTAASYSPKDGQADPVLTTRAFAAAAGRRLSLKQLRSGELMLGGGWPGIASDDRRSYTMLDSSIAGGRAAAVGVIPAVGEQRIVRKWCGLEAECFDHVPLIGPIPGVDGLTVAVGFSGHGFAIAPAVGRCVADQLAGRPTPELAGLAPSRMAAFDPDQAEQFVNDRSEASLAIG